MTPKRVRAGRFFEKFPDNFPVFRESSGLAAGSKRRGRNTLYRAADAAGLAIFKTTEQK
jgi:hypothetical protein